MDMLDTCLQGWARVVRVFNSREILGRPSLTLSSAKNAAICGER